MDQQVQNDRSDYHRHLVVLRRQERVITKNPCLNFINLFSNRRMLLMVNVECRHFFYRLLQKSILLGLGQMSEREMMQKALIQSIHDVAKSRIGKNNTDDEYDSP
jgi:hypothetical protein